MDYKLIKKFPNSPELGFITKPKKGIVDKRDHYWAGGWFNPEEFPEFWEKVVKVPEYVRCIKSDMELEIGKVYKVLKKREWTVGEGWVYDLEINKKILQPYYTSYFTPATKEEYDAQFKLILVTEDDVKLFEGDSYWFIWVTNSCARGQKPMIPYYVKQWITVMGRTPSDSAKYFSTKQAAEDYIARNKVLFVTEDGIEIKENDYYCWVDDDFCIQHNSSASNGSGTAGYIYFSSEEKAQEYIDMNKPQYSKQQLYNAGKKGGWAKWEVTNLINVIK